jgi:UDP-N-acetylglucosamine--N-acetylmuramyl-(pentapeptide) pyrophosphoryl-undecaprenol N-acetylglucosamine transferase
MNRQRHRRIIISGGGTGGHIFPAISIANALKKADPSLEILFVGAEGRMEMERVPAAGYNIVGLPVAGFNRKNPLKNFTVIFRLFKSLKIAGRILKDYKPDAVVGVGGYASGPLLRKAGEMGIPFLIQEQNSYAGITNKILARKAKAICVAYEGMEKYFPAEKIIMTGNPVRQDFNDLDLIRKEALSFFGFDGNSPVILVLGGSLGAGTLNRSLSENLQTVSSSGCGWIWQTGSYYYEDINALVSVSGTPDVKVHGFIGRMDFAYSAADIIISRAGAGTISELCLAGKPVILVPSPNVAEDHQTKNALSLSARNAAIIVRDDQAVQKLVPEAMRLVNDEHLKKALSDNIKLLAEREADIRIAREVLKLIRE